METLTKNNLDYKKKFRLLIVDFTGKNEGLINDIYNKIYDKCEPWVDLESINIHWSNTVYEYTENLNRYICDKDEKFFSYIFIIDDYKDIIQAKYIKETKIEDKTPVSSVYIVDVNEFDTQTNTIKEKIEYGINFLHKKDIEEMIVRISSSINTFSSAKNISKLVTMIMQAINKRK